MHATRSLHGLIGLLASALVVVACSGNPEATGGIEEETLPSAIVGDDYLIQVRLPPGYDPDGSTRYPVVYQLDGTNFGPEFEITAGHASELEAEGSIPPVIVVGIGYPYDDPLTDPNRGRMRDLVVDSGPDGPGGGDNFHSFIVDELIPHIDGKYLTDPERRVLSGHSLGGFFSLYVMLKTGAETKPLFQGFIAGDPSFGTDDLRLLREELALSEETDSLHRFVYVPIARYDGAVQQLYFRQFTGRLADHYSDIHLRTEVMDTDHGGVISPGFRDGLAFIFAEGQL